MYELLQGIVTLAPQQMNLPSLSNLQRLPSINANIPQNLNDLCWDTSKIGVGM